MNLRNILLSCWIKKYVKVEYKDFWFLFFEIGLHFGFEIFQNGFENILLPTLSKKCES